MKKINKIQGFTLLELMITLAIAIIVASIGVPSFMGLIRDSRMTTLANDFLTDLSYARSEAVTRNETVIIQSESGTNNWNNGWYTFYLDDNSTPPVPVILRRHIALPSGYDLLADPGTFNDQIVYESTGLMATSFNGESSFFLCINTDASTARAVVINSLGRAKIDSAPGSCS